MSISGWIGLGALRDGAFVEYEGYTRPRVLFSLGQPSFAATPAIEGPTKPVHGVVSHGALFDTFDGPRAILVWPWLPPAITIPAPNDGYRTPQFPPVEITVCWTMPTQIALNASIMQDAVDTGTRGSEVGTLNGRPILAAQRLAFIGGTIVARASVPRVNKAS